MPTKVKPKMAIITKQLANWAIVCLIVGFILGVWFGWNAKEFLTK